ncbi:hypothetical protein GCM10009830_14780 [Glycomyces endophyticus]|uniref:Uncharacterized protein n=1 Tax=Glycomyces endophyticus TaxID=480996 RepID=A0ABN2GEM0_9ACTN
MGHRRLWRSVGYGGQRTASYGVSGGKAAERDGSAARFVVVSGGREFSERRVSYFKLAFSERNVHY